MSTTNPLLNEIHDVFPPVQIALPTKGRFYPEGVLAENTDPNDIFVGTLGIMDEFKYRDPFMLVSGNAIDSMIHHVCGEQILIPTEMCEIDIETILLAARLASYGPAMKVVHKCQQMKPKPLAEDEKPLDPPELVLCGHDNTVAVNLHEFILRYGPIEDEAKFEVKLPKVGQTVYLKPTPYRTVIKVMKNVLGNRKRLENIQEQPDTFVMDPALFAEYEDLLNMNADLQIETLLDCIYAVKTRSGHLVEDPENIAAWIFELPKSDHDVISTRMREITDDFHKLSLLRYQCAGCSKENEFNLQMNSEILFLAGAEDSETPRTSSATPPKNKNSFRTPSRISRK